jgi:hypothetical protein
MCDINIYCNESQCKYCQKLETPVLYNFDNEHYKAFSDDLYTGKCTNKGPFFGVREGKNRDTYFIETFCDNVLEDEIFCDLTCDRYDCSWCSHGLCSRSMVFISKSFLSGNMICKSYSQTKIKGHRDWMSILNPDGTAKGGHIDDDYAKRLDSEARKFKVFPDGRHREANPRQPSRR